jgi:hypothetical protein
MSATRHRVEIDAKRAGTKLLGFASYEIVFEEGSGHRILLRLESDRSRMSRDSQGWRDEFQLEMVQGKYHTNDLTQTIFDRQMFSHENGSVANPGVHERCRSSKDGVEVLIED